VIVIDANVLTALLIPGPLTAAASRLAESDRSWAAPLLVLSEFRNVLATLMRRRILNLPTSLAAMRRAESALAGQLYQLPSLEVLALADESGCTAYDCEYVGLAKRLGVLLVTDDRQLRQCFPKIALPLDQTHRK
jgi:predicted nucleic acid-binding protein